MTTVIKELDILKDRVAHLEKILIIGEGDRLPLAEIVRNLTKTVSDYITQKQTEEDKKKAQWDRLKWIVISFAVPGILIFLGQAFVFFFKIWPMIENLGK